MEEKKDLDREFREYEFCVIKCGGGEFHLPMESVREVVEAVSVFPLPLAPDYVRGLIPLRGKVIPAIDLSVVNSGGPVPLEGAKVLIVDVENEHLGFITSELPGFVPFSTSIAENSIVEPRKFFEKYRITEASDVPV